MDYRKYVSELRKAADYWEKNHPNFPDVIGTYRRSADVIEELCDKIEAEEQDG